MEMQTLTEGGKEKKGATGREPQEWSRERESLNFNPRVTEFTDICTGIRLAVPRGFSQTTLSLLSAPKTYSSSYIGGRMRPFTVMRAEKGMKNPQKSKLN